MWVLLVGSESRRDRSDGALGILRDLGARVRFVDLRDPFEVPPEGGPPPVLLLEAGGDVDGARFALRRLRRHAGWNRVPALLAVEVRALGRVDPSGPFDDFVLMPFVPAELLARIRRLEWQGSEFASTERIKVGPLLIDLAAQEVSVEGRSVRLTAQEFALLRFFCEHRGRVFTREQLLERVWGIRGARTRTVDVHVRRLRAKLGAALAGLETRRGVGYMLREP